MATIEHGIILYTIEENGCLNGVYTNANAVGAIRNEIARNSVETSEPTIEGVYDCAYFEVGKQDIVHSVKLHISRRMKNENVFDFRWMQGNTQKFTGVGYKMSETKLAVHYWDGK